MNWLQRFIDWNFHKHLFEWERPIFTEETDNGYGVGSPIIKRETFQCIHIDKVTGVRCPKMKVKKFYYGR